MPVWLKLALGFLCLNAFILGMGWYSNQKLAQTAQYIEEASARVADVTTSVNEATASIEGISQKIGDVSKSIDETSALTQEIYHKPLQSINFARTAQNDFTSVDFALYKAYQTSSLDASKKDLKSGFELFKENFEIAEEKAISEDSGEYIAAVNKHAAEWSKLKDNLIAGTSTYGSIEPVSKKMQEALSNLVEFEAAAGYDFVLSAETTTENAHKVSAETKQSAQDVTTNAANIKLAAENAQNTVTAAIADAHNIMEVSQKLAFLAASFGIIIAIFLAFNIIRPIRQALRISASIADGNLDNKITSKRKDELGRLLRSLDKMQNDLKQSIASQKDSLIVAQEKAEQEEQQKRQALLGRLADGLSSDMAQTMSSFKSALLSLQKVADNLSSTASTSRNSTEGTLNNINEVNGNVTTIASASEELYATAKN